MCIDTIKFKKFSGTCRFNSKKKKFKILLKIYRITDRITVAVRNRFSLTILLITIEFKFKNIHHSNVFNDTRFTLRPNNI